MYTLVCCHLGYSCSCALNIVSQARRSKVRKGLVNSLYSMCHLASNRAHQSHSSKQSYYDMESALIVPAARLGYKVLKEKHSQVEGGYQSITLLVERMSLCCYPLGIEKSFYYQSLPVLSTLPG